MKFFIAGRDTVLWLKSFRPFKGGPGGFTDEQKCFCSG